MMALIGLIGFGGVGIFTFDVHVIHVQYMSEVTLPEGLCLHDRWCKNYGHTTYVLHAKCMHEVYMHLYYNSYIVYILGFISA